MPVAALLVLAMQNLALPPFDSLALSGGGEVIVRHGPVQRVTLRQGSARHNAIRVAGGRLAIDHCRPGCPRGDKLAVEIVAPRLASVSVSNGGLLRVEGGFPAQDSVAASVANGGAIDIRALAARHVAASVAQGGLIFTRPRERLEASVTQGGRIAYWGSPVLRSSVRHGGVVERGAAADADRPLVDRRPNLPRLDAIPPVPPLPSLGN